MTLHGLTINTKFESQTGEALKNNTPIGLIGTAESGTLNTLIRVRTSSDIDQFGDAATGNIVNNLHILEKYGCNNIYVIRVEDDADPAVAKANLIGSNNDPKTGLYLFNDVYTKHHEYPELIVIPGTEENDVVVAALSVADTSKSLILMEFATGSSVSTITTARGAATGLGTKSTNLIVCAPKVKNGTVLESLAVHFAGVIARTTGDVGFGYSPSNKLLEDITGVEDGFTLSFSDSGASNQVLEDLGVVSVNLSDQGYLSWGNYNANYQGSEDAEDFISIQRIRQIYNQKFEKVAILYIDQPSNFSTAKLLESALKNVISDHISRANISPESKAVIDEVKTDYEKRHLQYNIELISMLPIELVTLNVIYSADI